MELSFRAREAVLIRTDPDEFLAGFREELWQDSPEVRVVDDVAVGQERRPERCGCQTHQLKYTSNISMGNMEWLSQSCTMLDVTV